MNTVSESQSSGSSNGHPTASAMVTNDYNDEDAQLFPFGHPSSAVKRKLASFNNGDRHIVGTNSTGESYTSSVPLEDVVMGAAMAAAAAGVHVVPAAHPVPVLPAAGAHRSATSPTAAKAAATATIASIGVATAAGGGGGSAGKKSRIE